MIEIKIVGIGAAGYMTFELPEVPRRGDKLAIPHVTAWPEYVQSVTWKINKKPTVEIRLGVADPFNSTSR